jgi:DNA-binding transcriptional ArsR family regulator
MKPTPQGIDESEAEVESHSHGAPRTIAHARAAVVKAARVFKSLGDEERLTILALLSDGELCVTEIADATKSELSTVSQRLRLLRTEGLIARRRNGKHIYYDLADGHVRELVLNALAHANE